MKNLLGVFVLVLFAFTSNAQRIKSVTPNSGTPGQTLNVTITGANTRFTQGSNSNLYGVNFTNYFGNASNTYFYQGSGSTYTVLNDSTFVIPLIITNNAIEGYYDVSTNIGNGPFGLKDGFYINAPSSEKLISVNPNSATPGQTLNVTITGRNLGFTQGSSNLYGINFTNYFGNASNTYFYQGSGSTYTVLNDSTFVVPLIITNDAIEGYYDVITNIGNGPFGLKDGFYINAPNSEKLISVNPSSANPGETLNVTITGRNTGFTQGSNLNDIFFRNYFGNASSTFFYQGSGSTYSVLNDSTIIVPLVVTSDAIEGFYDVSTNIGNGPFGLKDAFYVNPRPLPAIKSIAPNNVNAGTNQSVIINCSNTHFTQASSTTIEFSYNPTNAVNSYNVLNDSQLVANITVPSNIYTDDYDVYVSNDIDGDMNLFDSFHVNGTACSINAAYAYVDNGNGNYSFSNSSSGNIVNTNWNFGDGTSSTSLSPNHTFTANGDYVVVLTVTDALSPYGYCYDYSAQLIHVTGVTNPLTCNASFSIIPDTNLNKVYIFNCSTGNNLSYFWDFGDGNSSTNPYPNYSYTGVGPFNLCLTVNDGMGCSSTYCDSISINGTVVKQSGFTISVNEPTALGVNNNLTASTSSLLVSPNPSNGLFNLEMKDLNSAFPINVFDMLGNLVYQRMIYSSKSTLDIRSFPAGVYILRVEGQNPVRLIKK